MWLCLSKLKNVFLMIIVAIWDVCQTYEDDPCTSYNEISDLLKRSPSYNQDVMPLCDKHLTTGWYRAGYLKMPTSPPALGSCGTNYPVWLNGDHPSTNEMKNVTVCKVGTANPCSQEIDISVKNCSSYIVYQLPQVNCCNSAYCFESDQKCTLDVPKDPSVSYYNLSWNRKDFGRGFSRYDPSVNLICRFTPLKDDSLFYDISWYVDDLEVVKGQTVTSHTLDHALLSAFDILKKNKTAGSMIHCVVGRKPIEDGSSCAAKASPLFFAGIKVLTPQLYIKKGNSADLKLQLTIPYADETFVIPAGYAHSAQELIVIVNISTNTLLECDRDYMVYKRNDFMICEIRIEGYSYQERGNYGTDVWKRIYSMSIHNHNYGDVALSDRVVSLQLRTRSTHGSGSRIFSNIKLQEIQVNIYSDQAPPKPTVPSTTLPTSDDCAAVIFDTSTPSTPMMMTKNMTTSLTSQAATTKSKIILNKTKCKKRKRTRFYFCIRVRVLRNLVLV
ncbi:von Willebrand factor D and EGF domain-containing protein-like [Saccostrea cucullata]|uniref:von Willebrand factor D and EGF domain-containing protein-like n=1 Tax=Saccostrea cuccullata TaxID=36930 RepID=UPI002ECFDCCF